MLLCHSMMDTLNTFLFRWRACPWPSLHQLFSFQVFSEGYGCLSKVISSGMLLESASLDMEKDIAEAQSSLQSFLNRTLTSCDSPQAQGTRHLRLQLCTLIYLSTSPEWIGRSIAPEVSQNRSPSLGPLEQTHKFEHVLDLLKICSQRAASGLRWVSLLQYQLNPLTTFSLLLIVWHFWYL